MMTYHVCMKFIREIVHEPKRYDKRHLTSAAINAPTFAMARIKQGGYGILDETFWVQRTPQRGFHVIVLTLSGKGRYYMEDGTVLTSAPGQAFISNAMGQGHREETIGPAPWEMIWLTIWKEETPDFLPHCQDYEIIPFTNGPLLKTLFLSLMKEEVYSDTRSPQAVDLFEQLFLLYLERALGVTEALDIRYNRSRILPLWESVTSRIGEPWSVPDLCKEAGISRPHLSRLCLALYQKGPGEMVRSLKMDQAKQLLINSSMTIKEIANLIGYSSAANFTTSFTHVVGMSPKTYRTHMTQNGERMSEVTSSPKTEPR